jgi:hypothetical protein
MVRVDFLGIIFATIPKQTNEVIDVANRNSSSAFIVNT